MATQFCMACMRPYNRGEAVCACGNRHGQEQQPNYALRCGSILNGQYLVGKMIGQGGFGITYVGLDLIRNQKVAIKEYFPSAGAKLSRIPSSGEIQWNDDENSLEKGYESFLKEARKMAKLEDIPGIVGVRELLLANRTAYIVMNFVEGVTLKQKLDAEGLLSFEACTELLRPVIDALDRANRQGIIHRDISPDNIMIEPSGMVWVLDMGASKDMELAANGQYMPSTQLVVKPGFSPPEQYVQSAKIGSWTDVYAMCATIFYCVTGKLPPMAPDRMFRDSFQCMPPLTQREFDVLKAGMSIDPVNRIQTMAELNARLQKERKPAAVLPLRRNPSGSKMGYWLIPIGLGIVALLCVLLLTARPQKPEPSALPEETAAESTEGALTDADLTVYETETVETSSPEATEVDVVATAPGGYSAVQEASPSKPKPVPEITIPMEQPSTPEVDDNSGKENSPDIGGRPNTGDRPPSATENIRSDS